MSIKKASQIIIYKKILQFLPIAGVFLLGVGIFWGIFVYSPSTTIHYKITLSIDTPQGIKTGYSIRSYYVSMSYDRLKNEYTPQEKTTGESVSIDLGEKGILLQVIDNPFDDRNIFLRRKPKPVWIEEIDSLKKGHSRTFIPNLSKILLFKNAQDPQRFEPLGEIKTCDTLQSKDKNCIQLIDNTDNMLGSGYKIISIRYEITDEPLTEKIGDLLPWIERYSIENKELNGLLKRGIVFKGQDFKKYEEN